jgi:3',5'-nucleoside bisphosphate phosphatase
VSLRADLHIHTRYSDGSFGPENIVRIARERSLCCISITDHDTVRGIEEAITAGRGHGVEIIPGVEISAEEAGREIHILGYCIDYKDPNLVGFLNQIKKDRIKRLFLITECLQERGIKIHAEEILRFAGDASISRLHIAKFMQLKGIVDDWRHAFTMYIGDAKPCYVSSFSYKSKQVIDAIKASGGIPVIAHPGLYNVDNILPRLIEEGLGGIEVFHTEHSEKKSAHYQQLAKYHNLVITGGSDCHGNLKKEVLIGKTTVPYSCVEALKHESKNC